MGKTPIPRFVSIPSNGTSADLNVRCNPEGDCVEVELTIEEQVILEHVNLGDILKKVAHATARLIRRRESPGHR